MKQITYQVEKKITEERKIEIEDDSFICVESWRNGNPFITAFIGKRQRDKNKLKIEISVSGDFLNFNRMSGSAEMNAVSLLVKDKRNKVVTKEYFLKRYEIVTRCFYL